MDLNNNILNFNNILGQKEIVESLKNSVKNDKISHSYIFSGPKGIGKKTLAKVFSYVLLCTDLKEENEGCGKCLSCKYFLEKANPDFYIINSSGLNIMIEDIRKMQSDIVIKPLFSKRKVYLIIDGEKMTAQAQNCLLKTLEEPPGNNVIIITTSNCNALLATVQSRCVKYSFKRNTNDEVQTILKSKTCKLPEEMNFILKYSDGIIGTALEIVESNEFFELKENLINIVLELAKENNSKFFEICNFFVQNKDNIDKLLDIMFLIYSNAIFSAADKKEDPLVYHEVLNKMVVNECLTIDKLLRNIETIEQTKKYLKQNVNFELAIETMIIKLKEE